MLIRFYVHAVVAASSRFIDSIEIASLNWKNDDQGRVHLKTGVYIL